jgi:hypothetical protein
MVAPFPGKTIFAFAGSKVVWPLPGSGAPYTLVTLTGQTVDKAGAAVGNVVVELFNPATNALLQMTVSDGSGNFSFTVGQGQAFQLEGYKAGSPDIAGVTRVDVALGSTVKIFLRDPTLPDSGAAGSGYSRSRVANMAG